ncbi:MAG TPA: threonine/serine dehydratase, partial [Dehalococcoidia bacterium]|nr:threonine/serine dehydratase [Dehalococcoidia bacterium]
MGLNIAAIEAARARLAGVVRTTPLLESRWWSAVAGAPVWLKAENLQRTGSFKIRGASNLIAQLAPEERERGVIAASAGNHAQGVAVAAQAAGIPALVVMPETAPFAKVEATRGYGAEVIQIGMNYQEAASAMERLAAERGLTAVPAFDDERIVAGQGTLGLELVEQLPDLDRVLVPVGGGGLAAGVALAVKSLRPQARIVGVQAAAAPAAARSWRRGGIETVASGPTIADGIAVSRPGAITLPLLERYLDEIVVVGEEAISEAIVGLMEYSKLV